MSDSMSPQGQDPNQPAPDTGAPNDAAFGFQPETNEEKYNTQYLVGNLHKDRLRNQLIIVGVIAAAVLGIVLWLAIGPSSEPALPPLPPTATTAPVPAPAAAPAVAPQGSTPAAQPAP